MSIVKHSYVSSRKPAPGKTGAVAGLGRALAHVKYIQHRPGPDREESGRELFDDARDVLDGKMIRAELRKIKGAKVVVHKLILSPEIPVADQKEYTREIMDQLSKEKGLDLTWAAAGHKNTDHDHVHVVLLGVDKNGKDVFIGKRDHAQLREASERYLERVHPIELDRYRQEQENKRDRERAQDKSHGLKSPDRALEGIRLPGIHRKIVREQLEPYKDWKQNKDQAKSKADAPAKGEAPQKEESIEAAGKKWSKTNSHKELSDLNQYLWDNHQERIAKADYKKLLRWIKEKEVGGIPRRENSGPIDAAGKQWTKENSLEELQSLNAQLWENLDQRIHVDDYKKLVTWIKEKERAADRPKEESHRKASVEAEKEREDRSSSKDKSAEKADSEPKKDKESFKYNGQTYNEKTSPEKLSGLAKKLRKDKTVRLPIEDYQRLRGWIEDADRAPWSNYLSKHIKSLDKSLNKERAEMIEHGTRWVSPAQQELLGNPVIGVFLKVASVANELVKWMPAKDVQDDLSTAHKVLKQEKSDRHKITTQIGRPKEKKEFDEQIFERLEEELVFTEDKIDKAKRKKQRKTKEKEIEDSRDDPFIFDPWGKQ